MLDEPRRHPWLMIALAVSAIAGVPFAFIGSGPDSMFGLPLWLWWSFLFTVALSGLTVLAVMKYWRDDDHD